MIYIINKGKFKNRRGIISTIKSMNPPEAPVHIYQFLDNIVDVADKAELDRTNKLLIGAYFLKQIGNRVRQDGESIKIEY